MRSNIRMMAMVGVLTLGGGLWASSANAQGYGYGGGYVAQSYTYSSGGYAPSYGYGGGYAPSYGYGGGGYAVPTYSYYGNGGHDTQPHMHTRQTPFGSSSYYGLGRHDFRPHDHVESPYGITSYSNGRFSSTQSYAAPSPYVYRAW